MNSFETRSFDGLHVGQLNAKGVLRPRIFVDAFRIFLVAYFFDERFLVDPFFVERFFVDRFLVEPFFDPFFEPFFEPFFAGTFPPSLRASASPIAIACFLLVTFLPERPLFSVPRFRSRMASSTFSPAFFPYLGISQNLLGPGFLQSVCHSRR